MSFVLAQPWGLLALAALPLVVYLHRFIVRMQRREVSCLALWTDRETVTLEGRVRSHVPDRLVLLLELLATLALVLLLAGLDLRRAAPDHPRVGLVIDASASMAGGRGADRPIERVRAVLAEIARTTPGLRVSIVLASELPELLGDRELTPAAADAWLAKLSPHASSCRLGAALELASALGIDSESTLIFSDDPGLEHARLVRVGKPEANAGIVHASWPAGAQPFVVVHNFGSEPLRGELRVSADGGASQARMPLALPGGGEQPLELSIDARTQRIDADLPDDVLAPDNHVTLLRPIERSVVVQAAGLGKELQRAFDRALAAVPTLRANEHDADWVVTENPSTLPRLPTLVFLTHGAGGARLAHQPLADPFASLLDGFDGRDLVWSAFERKAPDGARVLLRDAELPLIWQHARAVFVNVDLERSNLLSHATFPILIANLADEIDAGLGGLPGSNFHQGERLRFAPARAWTADVQVHAPSGRALHFERGATIDLGLLTEPGVYSLAAGSVQRRFAVQFGDALESDLLRRSAAPTQPLPSIHPTERAAGPARSALRAPLILIALLCAGAAYALLSRRPRAARPVKEARA